MAFEFKKKESLRKAVKRLGRQRIKKALGALEDCAGLEAVHEVRKHIKQLRAFLRLVRPGLSRSQYRKYTEVLRDTAGRLASARDAHVKVSALAQLTAHFKRQLRPHSFRSIKNMLSEDCRRQKVDLSRRGVPRTVGRELRRLSGRFEAARLKNCGWAVLGTGIKRSYRAGRRGYRLAREAGTPEHFHEWRKRVKDLFYQAGLLCPIWPEQMGAMEATLKHLGECLGDDHDLFLLVEPGMRKRLRDHGEPGLEALHALVDERQKELRTQALSLGGRFYEEKPSVFCSRLAQYWKRWRRDPKSSVLAR